MQKNLLLKILMAPALLLAVACDQMPTEPVALEGDTAVPLATESFTLETSKGQTTLRWATPLKEDVKVSEEIEDDGGTIRLKPGIELVIPEDALDDEVDITIVSRAGEDVAFEFGPHGLEFNVPVQVRIELSALENSNDIMRSAKMAYYNGLSKDASRIKVGAINAVYYANQGGEIIEVLQTFDVFVIDGKYLEFETDHFSGYALAS
ncbi:MAG: hypothetical protein ACR2QM_00695 [Longimicrobiales bacterium]